MNSARAWWGWACLLWVAAAVVLSTGCGTLGSSSGRNEPISPPRNDLRIGDEVSVIFGGIPNPPNPFRGRIREDGTITLPLDVVITGAEKTPGQLEREIHDAYVPKYYRMLTVTVHAENRFFYVDGQVRNPDRHLYAGEMTITKAIAAAKGFTEFANRKRIKLTRSNGAIHSVNYEKALRKPALDLPVYPGDHIYVPRSVF